MSKPKNLKAEPRKVAVLVVHGVAARTNAPFENLDRVTEMLSSAATSSYPYYEKTILRLPIDGQLVKTLGSKLSGSDNASRLMKRTLEKFTAKETYFKTARNELLRRPSPRDNKEKSDVMVHLYECFWADISRGGTYGFFRKFIEFYQFVLDLCGLGRKTIQYARQSNAEKPFSRRYWAGLEQIYLPLEFLVSGIIPAANILLLCLLLFSPLIYQSSSVESDKSIADFVRWFFPLVTGLGTLCLGYFTISKNNLLGALVIGFSAGAVIFLLLHVPPDPSRALRLATGIGLFFLLSGISWYAYCTRKTRWRLSLCIAILAVGSFILMVGALVEYNYSGHPNSQIVIGLISEYLVVIASISCWFYLLLLFLLIFATSIGYLFADQDAKKALITAQIAGSISGSLIIALTLCCWQICPFLVTGISLGLNKIVSIQSIVLMPRDIEKVDNVRLLAPKWINHFLTDTEDFAADKIRSCIKEVCSATTFKEHLLSEQLFPISQSEKIPLRERTIVNQLNLLVERSDCTASSLLLILLAVCGISVGLAFSEIIATEMYPRVLADKKVDDELDHAADKKVDNELDHAFSRLHYIGVFLISGLTGIIPGITCIKFGNFKFPGLLAISGVLLVVSISTVFYSVLAVTLDVINWLREHPIEYTKRAQIASRFMALLKEISEQNSKAKKEGREHYQQLIIIAHSQGTVIATELLKAIKGNCVCGPSCTQPGCGNPCCVLDQLPQIVLFTMGSPLRQLYACRFPHLFSWAVADNKPDMFKVDKWINAFGSRDYVGRTLSPPVKVGDEKYIGVAAHTHYWDVGSPIAEELDTLIRPFSL